MNRNSEIERAILCRQTSPDMTVQQLANYYNIERTVIHQVFGDTQEAAPATKPNKRKPAERAIIYAEQNLFAHIGAPTLAEAIGCSLPTAHKIMADRPDIFRKIKWGTWEIRDPQADRKAEKESK
jgi:hypothetical protein